MRSDKHILAAIQSPAFVERFWRYVERSDSCWLWIGATCGRFGYGNIHTPKSIDSRKRPMSVHRVAWFLEYGQPDPSLSVCHTCDVPNCVRPSHLFLGTNSDNMRDCIRKGRRNSPIGESHACSKLSEREVLDIRSSTERLAHLAERYGVSQQLISSVRHRRIWKHLP